MPATLTIAGIPDSKTALDRQEKAGLRFRAARQGRQEWRGKSQPCAGIEAYGRAGAKVSEKIRL
jgi:hypothetical protein